MSITGSYGDDRIAVFEWLYEKCPDHFTGVAPDGKTECVRCPTPHGVTFITMTGGVFYEYDHDIQYLKTESARTGYCPASEVKLFYGKVEEDDPQFLYKKPEELKGIEDATGEQFYRMTNIFCGWQLGNTPSIYRVVYRPLINKYSVEVYARAITRNTRVMLTKPEKVKELIDKYGIPQPKAKCNQ